MDTDKLVSRRNVMIAAGSVVAVGALVATPAAQLIATGSDAGATDSAGPGTAVAALPPLARGSYEDWAALVGSAFAIAGGTTLRLAGVQPFEARGPRPRGIARSRAFVAMFDPTGSATLAGDLIYTASKAGVGSFPIFLSASADPRTPARMLAVFN